jgi:hypothetical protein
MALELIVMISRSRRVQLDGSIGSTGDGPRLLGSWALPEVWWFRTLISIYQPEHQTTSGGHQDAAHQD